jgi:hypothetical protein
MNNTIELSIKWPGEDLDNLRAILLKEFPGHKQRLIFTFDSDCRTIVTCNVKFNSIDEAIIFKLKYGHLYAQQYTYV